MTHAERAHTQKRLAERYGLQLSSPEIFQLAKRLAHGQGVCHERQSRHVARWLIEYQGQFLYLVFDRQRRSIITALPPLPTQSP